MHPLYFELTVGALAIVGVVSAALWDWRTRRVPNTITLPLLGAALTLRALWALTTPASDNTLLLALGGAIMLQLAWAKGFLGGGDVKVFTALWLLWPTGGWLVTWMLSLVLGYAAFKWLWPRLGWALPQTQTAVSTAKSTSLSFPALSPVAVGAALYLVLIVVQGLRLS